MGKSPECWSYICNLKSASATIKCARTKTELQQIQCQACFPGRFNIGAGRIVVSKRVEQGERGGRGIHSSPKTPGTR